MFNIQNVLRRVVVSSMNVDITTHDLPGKSSLAGAVPTDLGCERLEVVRFYTDTVASVRTHHTQGYHTNGSSTKYHPVRQNTRLDVRHVSSVNATSLGICSFLGCKSITSQPVGNHVATWGRCAIVQGYRLPRQMDTNVTLRIHSLGKLVRSLLLCDSNKSGWDGSPEDD